MNQNNQQDLRDHPQLPQKPSLFGKLTEVVFNFVIQSVFRAVLIYVLWNIGFAHEIHLPDISFASAVCASMLSIILFSSRQIYSINQKMDGLTEQVGIISVLMSSYIIRQTMKEQQLTKMLVNEEKKSTAKRTKKTDSSL